MSVDLDVEGLLAEYLREQVDVAGRIYTDLPQERVYPMVLVSRSGGSVSSAFALSSIQVRLDVWHDTHTAAFALASQCMDALIVLQGPRPQGCVAAYVGSALAYDVDPEAKDRQGYARPRYVIEGTVNCHP